jgi:DNA-binding protein
MTELNWLKERVEAASRALNSESIVRQTFARNAALSNSTQAAKESLQSQEKNNNKTKR